MFLTNRVTEELVHWTIRVYAYSILSQFREMLRSALHLYDADHIPAVFLCARAMWEMDALLLRQEALLPTNGQEGLAGNICFTSGLRVNLPETTPRPRPSKRNTSYRSMIVVMWS